MIYFDNAATGGFKPHAVIDTAQTVIKFLCANPGRSGHRLSISGAKAVQNARSALAECFDCSDERVIFTKNCTEALNTAIFGTLKKGGHVITTVFEHNSVLRPLNYLKEQNLIELDIVSPENGNLVNAIESKIKDNTYMICMNALSNVTGEELPIEQVALLAKSHGLIFLVDGAQGGGHIPLKVRAQNISILCLAGHKGLLGIMTSGALLLGDEVDVLPLTHGGTGSESLSLFQPLTYPDRLEAGTLNLPAITSLGEGVRYVNENLINFGKHLRNATEFLISDLTKIEGVTVFSRANRGGIVAFSIANFDSQEVADILSSEYDIAVRGGLHCAPLLHKHLNTNGGLVRASLAVQNSSREINFFVRAVSEIAKRRR